jgi:hypothetical protein
MGTVDAVDGTVKWLETNQEANLSQPLSHNVAYEGAVGTTYSCVGVWQNERVRELWVIAANLKLWHCAQ